MGCQEIKILFNARWVVSLYMPVGEPNWQANLLKHSWQTQRMISEPSETHRIVICLATETPLLEGVGQRQSFLR